MTRRITHPRRIDAMSFASCPLSRTTRFENRQVFLKVRDDGRRFDQERTASPRFGLAVMRELAEQIGGSLVVRTMPGLGTEIEVVI